MKISVRVKRIRPVSLPAYAHAGDAGMDVVNAGPEIVLEPGERALVPTGLQVEIPNGYEIQVRPRSGLALRQGLTVLNSPGTIDCGYRGEIGVILCNLSTAPVVVTGGARIAQLVAAPVTMVEWQESDHLDESSRQDGGFGSTQ